MIFGFNTDVKQGDTVYHVQSEARENELILQTQVFVRGRCIGKRATSYAEQIARGNFTDQQKEQILRDQHRQVLDAIREGHVDEVLDRKDTPEALATVRHGRTRILANKTRKTEVPLEALLHSLEKRPPHIVPGTAVFLFQPAEEVMPGGAVNPPA